MAKHKSYNKEKKPNNPPKPRYTNQANLFHRDVIAPLERRYRQCLQAREYESARALLRELETARREHRILIHRNERVKIN
ncbi:hypothetical protein ADL26_00325 [Thermoactinomyces vulgaris]|jgi:hypothetical protein|nr:hypothetical protein ADL26_00325 [Thermoactinomyces vulgaris]